MFNGTPVSKGSLQFSLCFLRGFNSVYVCMLFKVHLTQNFFSAEMKLGNINKRNLPIFLVYDIFKGFKINRK